MKKYWHRWLAAVLALSLCLGAAGCGKAETPDTTEVTQEQNSEDGIKDEDQKSADAKDADAKNTDAKDTDGQDGTASDDAPAVATDFQDVWMTAEGAPAITASAAMLVDMDSKTVLYQKNAKEKMYPASMTKILTALVVMDHLKPDDLITVGTEINEVTLDSSKAGHRVGETLTVKNALRGLLIPSGNDSGNVLAAAVAKKVEQDENISFAKCEAIFTDLMNKKAEELGAVNSHFSNAHGYHDENHYSCAHDMALFAIAFMENETLAEIAKEKQFSGNGADGKAVEADSITQDYAWISHNLLVTDNMYQYPYAIGIKTGFTNEAGHCLTAAAEKDGTTLISVLFHGEDPARWQETSNLFDYGYNNYEKVQLTTKGEAVAEIELIKHNRLQGDTIPVHYQNVLSTFLPTGVKDKMEQTVTIDPAYQMEDKDGTIKAKAPFTKDTAIATVTYSVDGKQIAEQTAYASADVEKANLWNKIQYFFQSAFSDIFSVKGLIVLAVIVVVVVIVLLVLYKMRSGGMGRRNGYSFKSNNRRGRGRRRW